ncbi:MAG: metalloregulator ArsR/SmtB family transcription factor [Gemmatimonadota bacterium]|nr:metalloregulator ArsR/SmtB family transcription factor [Gemmatimonadota bacterium]
MSLVAGRFKALAEPARLLILCALGEGELSVSALTEMTALSQANLSKHLQVLHRHGFVDRRKQGLFVFYHVVGDDVFSLLRAMRNRLAREIGQQTRIFGSDSDLSPPPGVIDSPTAG